jgi:hypothetical protein
LPVESPNQDREGRLLGAEAIGWWLDHRGEAAPYALDAASSAISDAFGRERLVLPYVRRGPLFNVSNLFVAIAGTPDDEEDWERAVDANESLVRFLARAREQWDSREVDRIDRSLNLILSPEGETGTTAGEWWNGDYGS